jgi:hypothetical protein
VPRHGAERSQWHCHWHWQCACRLPSPHTAPSQLHCTELHCLLLVVVIVIVMTGVRPRPPASLRPSLFGGVATALLAMAALLALGVAPLSLSLSLTAQAQPVSSTRTEVATDFRGVRDLALDANGNIYAADFVNFNIYGDIIKRTPAGPSSPYACMRLAVALRPPRRAAPPRVRVPLAHRSWTMGVRR